MIWQVSKIGINLSCLPAATRKARVPATDQHRSASVAIAETLMASDLQQTFEDIADQPRQAGHLMRCPAIDYS